MSDAKKGLCTPASSLADDIGIGYYNRSRDWYVAHRLHEAMREVKALTLGDPHATGDRRNLYRRPDSPPRL